MSTAMINSFSMYFGKMTLSAASSLLQTNAGRDREPTQRQALGPPTNSSSTTRNNDVSSGSLAAPRGSVHLDVDVDVSDELEGGEEGDGAEHEEEHVAGEEGVAEELDRLQHARHAGALEVVEEGVQEHEDPRRPEHTTNTS